MSEIRFQQLAKWGGVLLVLLAISNVYFVLRYREVYRESTRLEQTYSQQLSTLTLEQQALEGVIRDFASKTGNDPHVVEILRNHGLIANPTRKP